MKEETYPRLLRIMLEEEKLGSHRRSLTFSPRVSERDLMMTCVLLATGRDYLDRSLSSFIMDAIKHYIATGLMGYQRDMWKQAIKEINKLKNKETPEDVERILKELYDKEM